MAEATGKLLTLTEVSSRTGISMPTLQRYKKLYQTRIPSIGKGRSQRYPEEALDVFHDLKRENIGRRGRPRKNKAAASSAGSAPKRGRKAAAAPAAAPEVKSSGKPAEGLLTLTQVSKLTNISYPTLLRYVKTQIRQIPHKGTGRSRRFLPEAVEVFKTLRGQSRRGRRPKAASASGGAKRVDAKATPAAASGGDGMSTEVLSRIKELEKTQKRLEKDLVRLRKQLTKPFRMISPIK